MEMALLQAGRFGVHPQQVTALPHVFLSLASLVADARSRGLRTDGGKSRTL